MMGTFCIGFVFAMVSMSSCYGQVDINPNTGFDGESYFSEPLYCDYGTLLYNYEPYKTIRASYTDRNNRDCCYLESSRNSCCMKAEGGIVKCKCDPSIPCGLATTTTTTTTTTTATITTTPTTDSTTTTTTPEPEPPASLCAVVTGRLLNGAPVMNECMYLGVANITTLDYAVVTCAAVLTTATINGVTQWTFLTAALCKDMIQTNFGSQGNIFEVSIGPQRLKVTPDMFTLYDAPNGNAFLAVINPQVLDSIGCQSAACPYDAVTMVDKVDMTDCKILSYGSNSTSFTFNGLHETSVKVNPGGCQNIPNLFRAANTMCYITTSGKPLTCSGDTGAPVYCLAPSNGEWILMGVTAQYNGCGDSPEVKVLPIPKTNL